MAVIVRVCRALVRQLQLLGPSCRRLQLCHRLLSAILAMREKKKHLLGFFLSLLVNVHRRLQLCHWLLSASMAIQLGKKKRLLRFLPSLVVKVRQLQHLLLPIKLSLFNMILFHLNVSSTEPRQQLTPPPIAWRRGRTISAACSSG